MGSGMMCEACGDGVVTMDHVYGIMACENCGRVVDDLETQLGSAHQAGHVMDRGGTFVGEGDAGNFAAGGVAGSGQLHHAFISSNHMKRVRNLHNSCHFEGVLLCNFAH